MADSTPTRGGDRLVTLLRTQVELYARLRELSQRQRTTITGDPGRSADALLDILRQRQSLVRKIVQANQDLAPFRRDWKAACDGLDAATRGEVTALVTRINESLSTILGADREDEALLAARRDAVADELSGLSGGRQANQLYAAVSGSTGAAADLSG